jgi:phage-related protein
MFVLIQHSPNYLKFCIIQKMKEVAFRGDSLTALRRFPESARRRVGQQLALVQEGRDPYDWKPMPSVGAGVREIRIRDEHGIFRVLYVTKFADRIYVLHCFQKKSQQTSRADIELAAIRYKELQKEQSR